MNMNLEELEQISEEWSLEEFVDIANQLLPNYLPDSKGNTKVKEEINARLVRHYTSQNLIDEPTKKNRYAVYTYRHLLQLLLVRRLLSDGIGTVAINDLVTRKSNEELKSLLTGGISINLTTAHPNLTTNSNPALDFLENIGRGRKPDQEKTPDIILNRSRQSISRYEVQITSQGVVSQTEWIRIEVLDGLEINLRSDFVYPNSLMEQESLTNHIIEQLTRILTKKKA